MRLKRIAAWGIGIVVVGAIGLYGVLVFETRRHAPSYLLSCMEGDPPLLAWTCKQVLLHDTLGPDQVEQLNREGGVLYPVMMENLVTAEEMLALFIARGVDVNAGDQNSIGGWTALHIMVSDGDVERVRMLLRHGARPDIRHKESVTPLDYARQMQQKYPNEPNRAEVVRILEEATKKQAELP